MMNPPTIDVLRAATMEGIVDVRTKWSWKCEMIIIVYAHIYVYESVVGYRYVTNTR